MRAAIYLRLSKEGEAPIERQRQDCTALVNTRGWELTAEYVDNLSAFREEVIRPDYVRLCDAIVAGTVDAVVVYHRDRLWRQVTDQATFARLAQRSGLKVIASVSEGDIDPNSSSDKFVMTILAAHAEMSSEDTRRRVRRAALDTAAKGKPSGGGYRAFGYERDAITLIEEEAELIRGAVSDILGGGSIAGIVNGWNADGVKSTTGGQWGRSALRNLLIRPRIAGIRQHQGREVGAAVWPAIVSEAEWRAVARILTGRTAPARSGPTSLLVGVALCGKCGAPLGSEPPRLRPDGRRMVERLYACRPRSDGGCRALSIRAARLDAVVIDRMFEEVDSGRLGEAVQRRQQAMAVVDTKAVLAELDADRLALEDLRRDYYVKRTLGRALFIEFEEAILSRIAGNEQMIGGAADTVDWTLVGPRFREAWDGKEDDLRWRRRVIRTVFQRVEVKPSLTRGGRTFDENRVVTVTF